MKEIKYKISENEVCITNCPYKMQHELMDTKVGSWSCHGCKHFSADNGTDTVLCKYDDAVQEGLVQNPEERKIDLAVNHPSHYNNYDIEVLEMMRRIWGDKEVKSFCKLNAFKYRMRAGHKDNLEQDLKKEEFYLNYMNNL